MTTANTNQRQRWNRISAGVFVLCLAGIAAAQTEDTPKTRALLTAIRAGGIPAAANLVGHYVDTEYDRGHLRAADLFDLSEASDLVARVVVTKKLGAHLGELTITTDFAATVLDRYHGPIDVNETVTLRMDGGFMRFANGTTAEIRHGGVPPIRVGEEYVVFLRAWHGADPADRLFTPRNGDESVYSFTAEGVTVPWADRRTSLLAEAYHGMTKSSFLEAVRSNSIP